VAYTYICTQKGVKQMASADNTQIFGTQGTITDSAGHVWQINADGKVVVDGNVDATTYYVESLAYVDGKVYQENINGSWWSKTKPEDTWSPADGQTYSPVKITDSNGHVWQIVGSNNGQVAVDGVVDQTTSYVINMVYVNGRVWQENVNHDWWYKNTPTDTWIGGTTTSPYDVSEEDAVVLGGTTHSITDAYGNTWAINTDGKITVNGTVDETSYGVTQLVYKGGKVYQENLNGDWWSKTVPTDTWAGGSTQSPLTASDPELITNASLISAVASEVIIVTSANVGVYGGSNLKFIGASGSTFVTFDGSNGNSVRSVSAVEFGSGKNETVYIAEGEKTYVYGQGDVGRIDMQSNSSVLLLGDKPAGGDMYAHTETWAEFDIHGVSQDTLNQAVANATHVTAGASTDYYEVKVAGSTIQVGSKGWSECVFKAV
jgi:hypothetical protein